PAIQFQRKAAGADSVASRPLRQGRQAGKRDSEDQSGSPRGDDRHDPIAGEFLHEPLSKARIHRLQRRPGSSQLVAQRDPSRLDRELFPNTTHQEKRFSAAGLTWPQSAAGHARFPPNAWKAYDDASDDAAVVYTGRRQQELE